MTTLHSGKSVGRSSLRLVFFLTFALACFAFSPRAQAVLPPPAPDGGYLNRNTAEGNNALFSLTTGDANTAVGWFSLKTNAGGSFNTAVGAGTLTLNTGNRNTAVGAAALFLNTSGSENTANGALALFSNASGGGNTAIGDSALVSNTIGNQNTASGFLALNHNTTGGANAAVGTGALAFNNAGNNNTAVGINALNGNTTGSNNVAVGGLAGVEQTTGNDNIYIGNNVRGVAGEDSACYIGSIYGQAVDFKTTLTVFIDGFGKLGTITSSKRFKEHIKPMDKASEAILALKPVTFHYKSDVSGTPQFGLIAEEVAQVNPDLIVRDKEGNPYSVRYDQVNAMLLNEFLKQHGTVQELKSTMAQQEATFQATVAHQQKQIDALTAGLQKVNAQLGANKPTPQMVNNP